MQFLVIGFDGKDRKALERRLAARPAHLALGDKLVRSGNMWYGAALLDKSGKMNGSVLLMDFPNRKKLQSWLDKEPYVVKDVWKKIEIRPCSVREPWQFNRPKSFFQKSK